LPDHRSAPGGRALARDFPGQKRTRGRDGYPRPDRDAGWADRVTDHLLRHRLRGGPDRRTHTLTAFGDPPAAELSKPLPRQFYYSLMTPSAARRGKRATRVRAPAVSFHAACCFRSCEPVLRGRR